jgi:aerobic-type carbon monoxide dehydrogenase small subunit (CoxS/CutS family)
MSLTLRINGEAHSITSDPDTPLLYVLRDELKLKGAKLGCGLQQCGACAVLVDGAAVLSCVRPASDFAQSKITTVEGLSALETGRRVQDAFIQANAAQCGYCTAGLVVAATALLSQQDAPDRAAAQAALDPHLCRCGAHPRVLEAVQIASRQT